MDCYHVSHEVEGEDISALDCVLKCDNERLKLENQAAQLSDDLVEAADVLSSFSRDLEGSIGDELLTEETQTEGVDDDIVPRALLAELSCAVVWRGDLVLCL